MAQAIKCVYEALPRSFSAKYLLMMRRFSSSSFTGMRRCEVAVGTERLVSMFSTIFRAAPRIGIISTSVSLRGTGVAGLRSGAAAVAVFPCSAFAERRTSASGATTAAVLPFPDGCGELVPSPSNSLKYDCHESSTRSGLLRKRFRRLSTYVAFGPNSSAIISERSACFCSLTPTTSVNIGGNNRLSSSEFVCTEPLQPKIRD